LELLKTEDFRVVLEQAIDRSEVLSRRFRHCAGRSLMILRVYMGRKKHVGRMQVGSKILFNAVKAIDPNFPILKEARREVMEDLMDYRHAQLIIDRIVNKEIIIQEASNTLPSPFAFGLIVEGYSDIIRIEDKQEFLKRMHEIVMAKISLKEGKQKTKDSAKEAQEKFSYAKLWEQMHQKQEAEKDSALEKLKMQVWGLKHVPFFVKEELIKLIEFGNMRKDVVDEIKKNLKHVEEEWSEELKEFVLGKIEKL